jgi:uncharacterized protein YdiU (UPF0061 family)
MKEDLGFRFDNSYLSLPECFYTKSKPVPVHTPEMVVFNEALAQELGLDFSALSKPEKASLFSGNALLNQAGYYAQAYAGHQFGHFTLLGDGRAVVWGEHVDLDGKKFDLQFKGSGPTPYSRRGDGRAALGPMLREYIVSEAMFALGVPTTRSLAVVTTGESVYRQTPLPGAILTRVASSHVRVGTFEFAAAQQDPTIVEALLNYTIKRHYPELMQANNKALALLQAAMQRQIDLMVQWIRVGFIHGVMNTDNVALSGETIDYGPCAFMDSYDPNTVFSSIDHSRRYAYANQPIIAQWNLARFAETLLPLIDADMEKAVALAEQVVNVFSESYQQKWLAMMRAKLGLFGEQDADLKLIKDLLEWMQTNHVDYTNIFFDLSQQIKPHGDLYDQAAFLAWFDRWQARLQQNQHPFEESLQLMRSVNPVVIPRNHQVEKALAAAEEGDLMPLHTLLDVLKQPYNYDSVDARYQSPPSPDERVYQTFCGT